MIAMALLTSKEVMTSLPGTTFADRGESFALHRRDAFAERFEVGAGMIVEDVLDPVHESTPRINWLSRRRESSLPWVVMCR